jgi:predicted alpha/beta hydrolase family esterase
MKKILLLHGWKNRRPEGHWMRIAAAELRSKGHQVWYPQFPSPETPDPVEWQELLSQESSMMDNLTGEKICIAHSLGTTNWLFGALNDIYTKPFDRVLLVAPPDPEMTASADGITGEPLDLENPRLLIQTKKWAKELLVIASDNDKWLPRGVQIYNRSLGIEPIIFRGAGHFSLDDGWGQWSGLVHWIDNSDPASLLQR